MLVSIINGKRLKRGLSPVGFINPTLYNNSASFQDIVSGHNKCSAKNGVCCQSGFYASKGWDPVTGEHIHQLINK